jgi:Zn-dependent membrane protease YugP
MRILEFYFLYLSTAVEYLLYALPGLAIASWAQVRIWRAYTVGSRIPVRTGLTGGEAAIDVMRAAGAEDVSIERAEGELCDHYDAPRKVLRLSGWVHEGRSLAAVAIAAHEAGHAIQGAARYPGLIVRNMIVPLACIGSTCCWLLVISGLLIGMAQLIWLGIVLFSLAVGLQLVNLPGEFDASRRAGEILRKTGVISSDEVAIARMVMNAAALTYVALALTGVLVLRHHLWPHRRRVTES